jgi:hypothetical protein
LQATQNPKADSRKLKKTRMPAVVNEAAGSLKIKKTSENVAKTNPIRAAKILGPAFIMTFLILKFSTRKLLSFITGLSFPSETSLKLKSAIMAKRNQKLPENKKNIPKTIVNNAFRRDTFSFILRSEMGQIFTI